MPTARCRRRGRTGRGSRSRSEVSVRPAQPVRHARRVHQLECGDGRGGVVALQGVEGGVGAADALAHHDHLGVLGVARVQGVVAAALRGRELVVAQLDRRRGAVALRLRLDAVTARRVQAVALGGEGGARGARRARAALRASSASRRGPTCRRRSTRSWRGRRPRAPRRRSPSGAGSRSSRSRTCGAGRSAPRRTVLPDPGLRRPAHVTDRHALRTESSVRTEPGSPTLTWLRARLIPSRQARSVPTWPFAAYAASTASSARARRR